MKCDAIIGITLFRDESPKDKELIFCTKCLEKKYEGRCPVITLTGTATEATELNEGLFKPLIEKHELLKKFSIPTMEKGNGLGLYIQAHGVGGSCTPGPKVLGALIAVLYKKFGLTFRKINIGICMSAGRKTKPKDIAGAIEGSTTQQICAHLAKAVDHELLDGVMVAGYRALVTLLEPEESKGTPRNSFSDDRYVPTHPHVKRPVELEGLTKLLSGEVETGAFQKAWALARVASAKNKKEPVEYRDYLKYAEDYVMKKIIWRFDTDKWVRGSIKEYTDSEAISDMVLFTEQVLSARKAAGFDKLGIIL